MKTFILSLIALALFAPITKAQVTGPVEIPGNEYAFQWTGDPDIGLYFSASNSRYEFRDLTAIPELWVNPVSRLSYFRGQVGVGTAIPTGKLEAVTFSSAQNAVIGRGINGPTNGYLGVQGDATDFDGITGLSLYGGFEIGALGLSTGASSTDNFGVLGYSNDVGVRGESSVSGNYGDLGTDNHGGFFNGRVEVNGGDLATLTSDGFMMAGASSGLNTIFGRTRIQTRNNGNAYNLILQPFGGNVTVGNSSEGFTERLFVESDSGQTVARFRIDGATKFRVNPNGGTSLGTNFTGTPDNGLYVAGDVWLGTSVGATGYRLAVNGKVICEELTVQDSGSWPDYVFEEDYDLTDLRTLSNEIEDLGHLPGIPSAAEVAENGASVGEMNRLLLEKVEELTLYIIELNEKIIELENK